MASTREEDMMRMQRMLDPGSVASPSEKLYMEKVNRLKELDPGSFAREGETAIMNRVFGSGGAVNPQVLDPRSVAREGEIRAIEGARSRENIPANMDMGMDSEMPVPMTVVDQVNALMAMGLTEDEALEAIAIERSAGQIQPQDFGQAGQEQQMQQMQQMGGTMQPMPNRMVNPGMGALSGVPSGNERPMTMPTPRPEDLMMRQMREGRTFNPRDAINPYNAPNT